MTFLREKMFHLSDKFTMPVCNTCGLVAVMNKRKNQVTCRNCNNNDISICSIPYACKLLFQDLMAMNIAPRIGLKVIEK